MKSEIEEIVDNLSVSSLMEEGAESKIDRIDAKTLNLCVESIIALVE